MSRRINRLMPEDQIEALSHIPNPKVLAAQLRQGSGVHHTAQVCSRRVRRSDRRNLRLLERGE